MDRELTRILSNVEDAFGFTIPEDDAVDLDTAGQLHNYVLAHRFGNERDAYLDRIAFHRIQQALTSVLHAPRDSMHESTRLSDILPSRRRRVWHALERTTGFHLPMLRRPHRLVMLATMAAIGLGIAAPLAFGLKPLRGANIVAFFSIAAFGYLFYWLTKLCEYELPPNVATVGQLAKATLARNYQPILAEAKKPATDAEVWETLRHIIGGELEIPYDEIEMDTELSRELVAG